MKEHTGVELNMDVTNKTKVIESLENNEVDFSLVSILPKTLNIENIPLIQNKLYLVGNKHIGTKRNKNDKSLLTELPLIFREKGSGTRQVMEQFLQKNNIPILKKMELTSNEAVKQALLAGLGYSIMPLIGIRKELNDGELKIIPIKGLPIKTTWRLIWLKGKQHSHVAKELINFITKNKQDIIADRFSWYEKY